ncbi:MAG: hypothetical protein L3J12_09480, partial [Spirochaetales bacterium]|nr:hypothetical protein [Spirochaetales bacterium]
QENTDPDRGIKTDNSETEDSGNLDDLTTAPAKFSGSVSAGLGMGAGLIEWPGSIAAGGRSFEDLMRYSGLYSTTATFSVDARPEPWLRFYSSVVISLNEDTMSFNGPDVNELFIDYTFKDTVFSRVGRQSLTWGHGRLIGNPANLVSRVSEGIAVRVTLPVGTGTLNGVVYSRGAWVNNPYSNINPLTYAYAGQWESSAGPLAFSLSSHFKMEDDAEEDIAAAGTLSFGIGSFDLAVDLTGHWDRKNFAYKPANWEALGQFFWENGDGRWSVLGEYMFDSSVEAWRGHFAALGLKTPKLASGWQPSLRWKHAFQDNSGELIAGISGGIAPDLSLAVGIPLVYGIPGSYYRAELITNLNSDGNSIPIDNVVSFLLSITLSFSF